MSQNKDWVGNKNSIFKTLGASNHCDHEREMNDYYATDPKAAELLLEIENIDKSKPIWEPACGEKHLSKVFENNGYKVRSSDLIVRTDGVEQIDFLATNETWDGTIITNPPYSKAFEFVEKSLETVSEQNKVIMFLKIQFLEGQKRRNLFTKYPPKIVYVSSSRLKCVMNGDFDSIGGSASCYCWFVWEKGFKGDPIIKWFN